MAVLVEDRRADAHGAVLVFAHFRGVAGPRHLSQLPLDLLALDQRPTGTLGQRQVELATTFRLGQEGEDRLAERGRVHRMAVADAGLHPERAIGLDQVDVDDRAIALHREVHRFVELMHQLDHGRAGELADLADAGVGARDRTQLRTEIVAVGRAIVVEEAGGGQRLQIAEGRRLRDPQFLADRGERDLVAVARDQFQHPQRLHHRLHDVRVVARLRHGALVP